MVEIFKKRFKGTSHIPIEEIKKQQARHKKDLTQPRDQNGELNPEFLHYYGAKNIRITEGDIKRMERKNPRYAKKLAEDYKRQQQQ